MAYAIKVEYAERRKMRERNTRRYRLAHWPIWIWVFFLAPGPLTFDLFAHGGSGRNLLWLLLVMAATGVAGYFGQLPGVEPRPYILRFTEDKPNPLYRKICYTFAWNAVITFTLLNLAGLVIAAVTGKWVMKQIYLQAYFPALRHRAAAGPVWPAAQSWAFDQGRGHRAAILLRGGVGGGDFADHSAAVVEDAAPVPGDEPAKAGSVCAELVRGGRGGRPWDAAPHPAHRSRPTDGGRLEDSGPTLRDGQLTTSLRCNKLGSAPASWSCRDWWV